MASGRRVQCDQGLARSVADTASLALVVVKIANKSGAIWPKSMADEFLRRRYDESDARVFSESWGPSWKPKILPMVYSDEAGDIDEFIFQKPDAFVCQSGGN